MSKDELRANAKEAINNARVIFDLNVGEIGTESSGILLTTGQLVNVVEAQLARIEELEAGLLDAARLDWWEARRIDIEAHPDGYWEASKLDLDGAGPLCGADTIRGTIDDAIELENQHGREFWSKPGSKESDDD